MIFDKCDNKIAWYHTDNATCHVYYGNRAEAHLAHLNESIDLTYALNHLYFLWFLLEQLLHSDVAVGLGHVIAKQWHLLHSDGIVV